jgi:hypothetical protein
LAEVLFGAGHQIENLRGILIKIESQSRSMCDEDYLLKYQTLFRWLICGKSATKVNRAIPQDAEVSGPEGVSHIPTTSAGSPPLTATTPHRISLPIDQVDKAPLSKLTK